jgi:hypothetical protein
MAERLPASIHFATAHNLTATQLHRMADAPPGGSDRTARKGKTAMANLSRSGSCRKASHTADSNNAAITSGSVVTGRLIDRYGHEHSEAIFRNWTPAAIKAMGIRRVGGDPKDAE